MNWVRHGGSTSFETKSSYCRVALHGCCTTSFQTSHYCRAKVEFNSINWFRHDSSTTFETGLTWLFIYGTNWLFCGTNWLFYGTIWLLIGTIWPWNEMTGDRHAPSRLPMSKLKYLLQKTRKVTLLVWKSIRKNTPLSSEIHCYVKSRKGLHLNRYRSNCSSVRFLLKGQLQN